MPTSPAVLSPKSTSKEVLYTNTHNRGMKIIRVWSIRNSISFIPFCQSLRVRKGLLLLLWKLFLYRNFFLVKTHTGNSLNRKIELQKFYTGIELFIVKAYRKKGNVPV